MKVLKEMSKNVRGEQSDLPSALALQFLKSDSDDTTDEDSNPAFPENVNRQDHNGMTLLMKAAIEDKDDKILSLLAANADINQIDNYGKTALIHAAKTGGAKALLQLIKNGADLECFDSTGNSALIYAIKENRKTVFNLLLQAGVDVNASSYGCPPPLMVAVDKKAVLLTQDLIRSGANANFSDKDGITALHIVARNKDPETLRVLIRSHANVNAKTKSRDFTPLASCLMQGLDLPEVVTERTKQCVEALVSAGADPNLTRIKSSTLSFSVLFGKESVVDFLFEQGIKIYIPFNKMDSVLSKVVSRGSAAAARYILQEGGVVNTELHEAVILGKAEMVKVLVQNGAMPTPKPISQLKVSSKVNLLSPLALTFLYNRTSIARYFLLNKFMLNYDLHTLPINSDIIFKLSLPATQESSSTMELFRKVFSQPWRLANIAFLALSNTLGVDQDREKKIRATGLPHFIQQKLMFKHCTADIPIDQWDDIEINM